MAELKLPQIWRKHVFAFIAAASTQLLQVGFMLLVVVIATLIIGPLTGAPIPLRTSLGFAVALCGLWTTLHLVRELSSARKHTDEKTPLSRRRALLSKVTTPFQLLIAVVSGTLTVFLSVILLVSLVVDEPIIWILIVSYLVFLAAWLGLELLDWYNDQYILDVDRIIDITRIPIIYEQRTEAPLTMVQNASTSQKGFGVLLDFGDVIIETAGFAKPLMFESIRHPKRIQAAIFSQAEVANRKKRERDREAQATQTQRWFEAYHTLTSGIRDIEYERQTLAGRPLKVTWRIEGPPERYYRTWLAWDTTSRAGGGDYAYTARPGGLPDYVRVDEYDGISGATHRLRGLLAPTDVRRIYFRIVVWFVGDRASHSSPEMAITVLPDVKV